VLQTALMSYPAEDLFLAEVARLGEANDKAGISEDFYSFTVHASCRL